MTALVPEDFSAFFSAVYDNTPFPWQVRLAKQVVETGSWPKLLDLPTGAGKTAAIDVAVFHLACEALRGPDRRAPIRILFVIDRRIVVDAATERAKRIQTALRSLERRVQHPVLAEVARRLSSLSGDDGHPLDVVRLRGGAPHERDWARSPAQPLVAVSTVDQVGSRLLFRGYGVSPRMWPVHAGLVGSDALWLLDEVHLSQPLEQTLKAIEQGHPNGKRSGNFAEQRRLAPFAAVRLSATPGKTEERRFSLSDEDRRHSQLRPRLSARKIAIVTEIDKEPDEAFADHALSLVRAERSQKKGRKKTTEVAEPPASLLPLRLAVVVNRVDLARRTFESIRKLVAGQESETAGANVLLLTGRVRPLDRDRIIDILRSLKLFADPDRSQLDKPVILVATQTIEAGADLDVDALVTEIAPLDCLRQRFGRLNRLGGRGESRAVILHPRGKPSKHNDWGPIERIYGGSAFEAKEWLAGIKGEINFGIEVFASRLREFEDDPDKLQKLLSPRANAPVLLPAYTDLWATTSPAPAATPEPALFLHGPRSNRDVEVVWRADIDLDDVAGTNVSLDLCPPSSLEALSLPVWAARRWLAARKGAEFADFVEPPPEIEDEGGGESGTYLRYDRNSVDGGYWSKTKSDALKPGDTIVVPATYGGYDDWGWNPSTKDEVIDLGVEAHYLQRLKGVLRLTRATLANALRREGREDALDTIWDKIRRALPEEGEDGDAADTIQFFLERQVALPRHWRLLIEGRDRLKGIKDRRPKIASFADNDWSRGCLLYSEKSLDAGLLAEVVEEEPEGKEAITERDDSSRIGERVALTEHLRNVEKKARAFAKGAGLDDRLAGLVMLAARLHDLGKAEPRFQADLRGRSALLQLGLTELESGELLAKSARGEGRRGSVRAAPENFRHEALSVALCEKYPAIVKLDDNDRDLVLWLVGTHHGYGRPFFPSMIDDLATNEVAVPDGVVGSILRTRVGDAPLRLDQGWFERAERLIRRFGPWELARLEAILRLADHAASAEELRATDRRAATAAGAEQLL